VRGEGGGVPWRGGWGRGKPELRRAEACLGGTEALCRAFPRGQNLQPMSSSDHFPARNRLQPKSVRIQGWNRGLLELLTLRWGRRSVGRD